MIIGICGKAGSGKGTAAKVFLDDGYVNGKFSAALKSMLRALLRYRGVDRETIARMIEGDLKELPTPHLSGKSPRFAMQTLGTEWGRECIHEDLWVETEFASRGNDDDILFDDVRHANEDNAIRKAGGIIIHLKGRGGIEGDHTSEQFVPVSAVTIENTGTVEELQAKVKQVLKDLSWAKAA